MDFLDRADVHECRPIYAQPVPRIEPWLEIRDRKIQRVMFLARCRECQLVLRVEVRDIYDVDEIDTLAAPGRHADQIFGSLRASAARTCSSRATRSPRASVPCSTRSSFAMARARSVGSMGLSR